MGKGKLRKPLYWKAGSPFIWYAITVDGKRIRKSTKKTKEHPAFEVACAAMEKARLQGPDSVTRKVPQLKDFAVDFLKWVDDTHSIADETRRFYKHGWEMLKDTTLAETRLDAIRNVDVETVKFPGGGYTANQALRTLRRMLTIAKEKGKFFGELPKIKMRTVWGRSLKMSASDATLIASKMKDGGDPKDVLIILRGTGMRPSECYAMRWELVNWEGLYYQNPNGKTKTAKRSIPLLDEAMPVLKRRHLEQGMPREGWVFPSDAKSGHILNISKAFREARKAAGLPNNLVLYTSRHGMMTDLASVLPLDAVMRIGGHTDAKVALGYQHTEVTDLQARLTEARTNGRIN